MLVKRLREMILEFLLIVAGTVLCATVFCTLFFRDILFDISLLWELLAFSLFCTLPGLLFCSEKEIPKKRMRIRKILHLCILISLLLFFGYYWGWLDTDSIIQPAVMVLLFALTYLMVWYFAYLREKKTAQMLNEGLKSYKQRTMK